jgi:hypothetical protein
MLPQLSAACIVLLLLLLLLLLLQVPAQVTGPLDCSAVHHAAACAAS